MHRTPCSPPGGAPTTLDFALAYLRRGWSLVPIIAGTKKPPLNFEWTPYQSKPAEESQVRKWFAGGRRSLAVILGPVSGNLVVRDYDVQGAYDRWAREHPDLATTLPTVATARGRHVYFVGTESKTTDFADGELRAGAGSYCVLPPSKHSEGLIYRWLIPLPEGPLPRIDDVRAAGLLPPDETESTEDDGGLLRITEQLLAGASAPLKQHHRAPAKLADGLDNDVVARALKVLPAGVGRRNRQVFELARELKAIPRLADAPPEALMPYVEMWHRTGVDRGVIGTEPFEETWIDFLQGWPKIKFPRGSEPMALIVKRAMTNRCPPWPRSTNNPS